MLTIKDFLEKWVVYTFVVYFTGYILVFLRIFYKNIFSSFFLIKKDYRVHQISLVRICQLDFAPSINEEKIHLYLKHDNVHLIYMCNEWYYLRS
jgi:hypothetical protein